MKPRLERVIPDTNFLVSAFLFPGSLPSLCLSMTERSSRMLGSIETLAELSEVLLRPKFDRYASKLVRIKLFAEFADTVELVEISEPVRECRDPKDDKFLGLALSGRAHLILAGDKDLLEMHPWRGIPIVTPATYMAR
jgi:putative PIN family toxin of toxin-antitoxin system